jgi:hypothetical protein
MTTKQYMMPISAEEYEKQKLDYTQQALKDLQNHLEEHVNKNIKNINNTNYKMKKNNSNNSNEWNDSNDSDKNNSVVEYTTDDNEDIDNVNITINREPKKYKTRSNSNKAKKNNPNIILSPGDIERYINQSMVHEYEVTIGKYKSSISALRNEINEENKKTHYLKLDLNNAICDNNDNKNKVMQLRSELLDKNKLITIQNDTLYKNKMHILALKVIVYIQIVIIFFLWIF